MLVNVDIRKEVVRVEILAGEDHYSTDDDPPTLWYVSSVSTDPRLVGRRYKRRLSWKR